jgi:hypothetical protein
VSTQMLRKPRSSSLNMAATEFISVTPALSGWTPVCNWHRGFAYPYKIVHMCEPRATSTNCTTVFNVQYNTVCPSFVCRA